MMRRNNEKYMCSQSHTIERGTQTESRNIQLAAIIVRYEELLVALHTNYDYFSPHSLPQPS